MFFNRFSQGTLEEVLGEVFRFCFRLGCLGFGGPMALIALARNEAVLRLKWLRDSEFVELLSVCKIMPGPQATQVVIAIAEKRVGFLGAIAGGVLFIAPSFFLILGLAVATEWASVAFMHSLPLKSFMIGMQGGALGLILSSVWGLSVSQKRAAAKRDHGILAGIFVLSALAMGWAPRFEPLIILSAGFLAVLLPRPRLREAGSLLVLAYLAFKAGAFMFGSGLAIVPLLETEVVQKNHWLTHAEFMEALAFGQITPGPVVITVTYIGYKVAGLWGAVVATFAVFFPAFCFATTLVPWLLRKAKDREEFDRFSQAAFAAVLGALWVVLGVLLFKQLAGVDFASQVKILFSMAVLIFASKRIQPVVLLPGVSAVLAVLTFLGWG